MDTTSVTPPRTAVLPGTDRSDELAIEQVRTAFGRACTATAPRASRSRVGRLLGFFRPTVRVEAASDQALVNADDVVWGFVVKEGFDELDDPWYHRGLTQHAYREGDDSEALCGFRPPLSGPRGRRRPRLALPTSGIHPMCNVCARRIAPPRQRVAVPVAHVRPASAVPMGSRHAPVPVPVAMPVAQSRSRSHG